MAFHHTKSGVRLPLENNWVSPMSKAISGNTPRPAEEGLSGAIINVSAPFSGVSQLVVEFEFFLVGAPSLQKGRLGFSLLDHTDPSRPNLKLYDAIEVTDNTYFSTSHFGSLAQGVWNYRHWESSQGYEGSYSASWHLDPAKTYVLGIGTLGFDTKGENHFFWHWAGAKKYQVDIASAKTGPRSSAIFLLEADFMATVTMKRMEMV